MFHKKIALILFLILTVTTTSGCSMAIANYGKQPRDIPAMLYGDGTSRQVVEKKWGKPKETNVLVDSFDNTTIDTATYRVMMQTNRAEIWLIVDALTLGFGELIGFPFELIGLFFRDKHEQQFTYINDTVANRELQYKTLVVDLLKSTRNNSTNPKIFVQTFTGATTQAVGEDLRYRFISTIQRHFNNIRLVDRNQIESILQEHKLNMTITSIDESILLGSLIGANYMVSVNTRKVGKNYDAVATLINVETGEIEASAEKTIW